MFTDLENNNPFVKAALEGFAGDGKSYTAVSLAIGIHKMINSTKPIALFDTERALKALKFRFDEAGIRAVANDENRSLESLRQSIEWCEAGNADVLIIDSITHVWEEFTQSYMKQKNRTRLEFQDWGVIKPMWKEKFSNKFVAANVHIIFTGRAGFEYENEVNEQGKREIYKSGIKMKAEGETAFEPDILVLMEKVQKVIGNDKNITRNATILKDRTTRIDGKTFINPTFEDFYPAIKQLLEGKIRMNLGTGESIPDTFENFENKYSELGRRKEKICNEIYGAYALMGLGTGATDKQTKAWITKKVFGINSEDNLMTLKVDDLEAGLPKVNEFARVYNNYQGDCLERKEKLDPVKIADLMKQVLNPEPQQQQPQQHVTTQAEAKTTAEATVIVNKENAAAKSEELIMTGEPAAKKPRTPRKAKAQ